MPLNLDMVRRLVPDREIHWHATIGSTMHEAVRLANAGCASGTVVGADEQTAGHGRHGRVWHSQADAGLYFSVVLRLRLDAASLPVVTFALGLAAAEAIQQTTGVACDLRWPNDVLTQDGKCAGILTQLHGAAVVTGIGVNVNQTVFPPDVASIATSLRIASGREQSRESLLVAMLDDIGRHCDILTMQGPAAIFDLFTRASSYVAGRRVTVELPDGDVTGTTAGLTEAGFLRLRRDDGGEEIIVAGGVRPADV
jgi:BirA family transcriptional regulator, biotin operon repressor / biotin---[acetyl-CoA-carboxylase] ligase